LTVNIIGNYLVIGNRLLPVITSNGKW